MWSDHVLAQVDFNVTKKICLFTVSSFVGFAYVFLRGALKQQQQKQHRYTIWPHWFPAFISLSELLHHSKPVASFISASEAVFISIWPCIIHVAGKQEEEEAEDLYPSNFIFWKYIWFIAILKWVYWWFCCCCMCCISSCLDPSCSRDLCNDPLLVCPPSDTRLI